MQGPFTCQLQVVNAWFYMADHFKHIFILIAKCFCQFVEFIITAFFVRQHTSFITNHFTELGQIAGSDTTTCTIPSKKQNLKTKPPRRIELCNIFKITI